MKTIPVSNSVVRNRRYRWLKISVPCVLSTVLLLWLLLLMDFASRTVKEPIVADADIVNSAAKQTQIWIPDSNPNRELTREDVTLDEWGGKSYAWGAPIVSGDGQVSLFPLETLLQEWPVYTLQQLESSPKLAPWLAPVGRAYRLAWQGENSLPKSGILFRYLAGNVPVGYELRLTIYYSPDNGRRWQQLDTFVDPASNHASARVRGEGIYMLTVRFANQPSFADSLLPQ